MGYLQSKKMLFIGPLFHNYHVAIIDKMKNEGAEVLFIPERKYNIVFKFINNLSQKKLAMYQERYYRKVLRQIAGMEFDYLFVIRGFMMPPSFVDTFRRLNPAAKTIMYQWDSNRTNPFVHLINNFDKVYSFDFEDCESNAKVAYHPLFYTDDVGLAVLGKSGIPHFDFFFMGWYFPERYAAVVKFREYAATKGWKLKAFLYMPYLSYIKERLKGIKPDRSIVSFRHMPRKEYLHILCTSKVMVDVSNPNQTGLAMRIIEAFACKTKVLTNNLRLKNDNVYDPSYVAFFDDRAPIVEDSFLNDAAASPALNVLTIGEWMRKFFED